MKPLLALGLVTAIQGVLSASIPCSGDITAKTRDGQTCYECGKSRVTTSTEQWSTLGKLPASQGDFPWSALILIYIFSELNQACCGTLISSQAVLTTVTCARPQYPSIQLNVSDFQVVLGSTHRSWNATEPSRIKQQVKEIRMHPDYKGESNNYANNIALLILESKVPFSSAVLPACLDYDFKHLPLYGENAIGYVSGLGNTEDRGIGVLSISERLMYTSTNVLSFDRCLNVTPDRSESSLLTLENFCVGNGTVSPVQLGDLGAGLTVISQGLHYVTGIVTKKIVGSDKDNIYYSFGAMTNVSLHMDWLKQNLPELKL